MSLPTDIKDREMQKFEEATDNSVEVLVVIYE